MPGVKEKSWKKWKESKTASPVVDTDDNTADSINSQRSSSSLIRSRKEHTTRDAAGNILAAENQGILIPSKNKSTSPFNTLAPTNPFNRENVIIVQRGKVKRNKAKSASQTDKANQLWGELPSTEVAGGPKAAREKGPKGESRHPAAAEQSHHEPSAPPASPTDGKMPPPVPPPAPVPPPVPAPVPAPVHAPPQPAPGPSVSPDPPAPSEKSQHPRTSPSSDAGNGICDYPECPARVPKQIERLCMAPECPVTLKKAVVKEAKKAMKKSCGKKRKNPLAILGAALMSTFAGHDSSCKLTKKEKKTLKRMKQAEKDNDDNCNASAKAKQSKGVQCELPMSQKNDRAHRGPEKANKSTVCDLPECPIVTQKAKVREFMDKGQLCNIPSCPVKEPAPRKEKKVEPPKGCPTKPCTLKSKDEAFLSRLDPCIFEKLPRLKMTCDQALAEKHGTTNHPQPDPSPSAIKYKDGPSTKEKDRGVRIVAAHVHVPPPSEENPFLNTIQNPREFSAPKKLIGEQSEKNQLNSDEAQSPKTTAFSDTIETVDITSGRAIRGGRIS